MARNLAGSSLPPGNGGVTFPSPNEWPDAVRVISNITKSPQATITCPSHGFTNAKDAGKTIIGFHEVKGMFQINGLRSYVGKVIDAANFTILLDTSLFSTYIPYIVTNLRWEDCATGTQFFGGLGLQWQSADFPWSGFVNGGQFVIIAGHTPYDPFTNILP